MELVAGMNPHMPMRDIADYAKRVESLGFDTLHVPEMIHDPFVVSGLALSATTHLRVRTGVALAFVRSPMATALSAWGLAELSAGRFDLGLGSQVRQNIVERYGMLFDEPVARLGEYVSAVRNCFTSFANQDTISFEGTYYRLTRLQKEFLPEPLDEGMEPAIWIGAVGEKMTALAGSESDGLITHPTNSHPLYLENHLLPNLESSKRQNSDARIPVVISPLSAVGNDDEKRKEMVISKKERLAFLYSTPAYEPTLKLLGYEDLGKTLRDLLSSEKTVRLHERIPDELFRQVVIECTWDELGETALEWFGGLVEGITLRPPDQRQFDQQFLASASLIKEST